MHCAHALAVDVDFTQCEYADMSKSCDISFTLILFLSFTLWERVFHDHEVWGV
jgi:hypothetical protein